MSKHCCLPQCVSTRPTITLFRVPAKRFCSGIKEKWAEDLEKIILSYRKDKGISDLYKKDLVSICIKHFEEKYIIKSKFFLV